MSRNGEKNIILIIMATFLFATLIQGLPYGFFTILKLIICLGSTYISIFSYKNQKFLSVLYLIFVIILFNPVVPIYFQKDEWKIIDVVIGLSFLLLIFLLNLNNKPDIESDKSKSNKQTLGENFLIKLAKGNVSLVITFWLFGILGNFIFSSAYVALFTFTGTMEISTELKIIYFIFFLLSIIYSTFICVAIWRSANNYKGPEIYRLLSKWYVVISIGLFIGNLVKMFW